MSLKSIFILSVIILNGVFHCLERIQKQHSMTVTVIMNVFLKKKIVVPS